MNTFQNLRIATRLSLGFGFAVVVMLLLVLTAKLGLNSIARDIDTIKNDRYVKIKLGSELMADVNEQTRKVRNAMLLTDPALRANEMKSYDELKSQVAALYDKLGPMLVTVRGKELYAALQKERAAYLQASSVFEAAVRKDDMAAASAAFLSSLRPQQIEYMKALEAFIDSQEKLMEESSAEASETVSKVTLILFGVALAGGLLSALAAYAVTRSVTRPLGEAVSALQRLEAGDLSHDVNSRRSDELGQMLAAVGRTTLALRGVVSRVRQGVESVSTASGQIAAGNQDLSSRTEQQASSLQQTAASMEEFSGSVRHSADNARQASVLAGDASSAAGRGGEVVGQVVATMEEISASSRRIADIIGTIDGIAFQTNILALNAAVEAARAGEQGRGFAVVASEVRSLAQRSADAAREIKSLIGSSVERVETGSRQVADAGVAMNDIVVQVRRVSDLIAEISSAAVEQSSGIGQVSQAVSQMDQVTQQNAALVEEAAAASQSLSEQARQLSAAVSVFKLQAA